MACVHARLTAHSARCLRHEPGASPSHSECDKPSRPETALLRERVDGGLGDLLAMSAARRVEFAPANQARQIHSAQAQVGRGLLRREGFTRARAATFGWLHSARCRWTQRSLPQPEDLHSFRTEPAVSRSWVNHHIVERAPYMAVRTARACSASPVPLLG